MSRIMSCTSQVDSCDWIKANQQQVERHPAWRKSLDPKEAEALLQRSESFTYLLRKGEEEKSYFITFVKEDLTIKHQHFTLEFDRKGWFFKNATGHGPIETIDELIPRMMHCDVQECKILGHMPD